MKRIPNPTHTLIRALDGAIDALDFIPASITQQQSLLENLIGLQVAHADVALAAIDVTAADYRVFARSRGDGDFDAGVFLGEGGEMGLEEGAVIIRMVTNVSD